MRLGDVVTIKMYGAAGLPADGEDDLFMPLSERNDDMSDIQHTISATILATAEARVFSRQKCALSQAKIPRRTAHKGVFQH